MKKLIIALIILAFMIPVASPVAAQEIDQVKWWDTLSDVRQWVKEQPTYFAKYIPEVYDCDNFALDLWRQSLRDNRLIGIREVIKYRDGVEYYHHLNNFTLLGDPYETNAPIVVIEARTGRVYYLGDEYQIRLDK